jgi:hypothetical protein
MKRSAALAPLSRDHQHALDAALRLRRAEADTVGAALSHFRAFFKHEGRAHFDIEEEHLLPALPADDVEWSEAAARVRDDHAAIRAGAADLAGGGHAGRPADRVAEARRLGERLHAHVRFEERTLFGLLELRLSPQQLTALGERVAQAEAQRSGGAPA